MKTTTFNTMLEHHDNFANKHKFYNVTIESTLTSTGSEQHEVYYNFGRIGHNCTPKLKATLDNLHDAVCAAVKLVRSKEFSKKDKYDIVSETNNTSDFHEAILGVKEEMKQADLTEKLATLDKFQLVVTKVRSGIVSLCYTTASEKLVHCLDVAPSPSVPVNIFDLVSLVMDGKQPVIVGNNGEYFSIGGCYPKPTCI
jgi:predicted DNA-binding WGR domain protein